MEIINEFTLALINGIRIKEGYKTNEGVISAIIKEHMDNLDDYSFIIVDYPQEEE